MKTLTSKNIVEVKRHYTKDKPSFISKVLIDNSKCNANKNWYDRHIYTHY